MPYSPVPISSPCPSLRPSTRHSPEWLVGTWQHEPHGANEICGEISVEGNPDMHFGYMPFVGHQGNAGLPSSWWMIKTVDFYLWLVIVGEIGFINHFDLEHLPRPKFHSFIGPQDFCRKVSIDSSRKAKDWFFQNGVWEEIMIFFFEKKMNISNHPKTQFNDLVVCAGLSPAQWRTVANALWCVLRLDLVGAETWEHFQCNSCVQMSGHVWERETW